MAHMFRNRLTLFFDSEQKSSLRVYLATLEQMNVFLHYFKRCSRIPFVSYLQEFYRDTWVKGNEKVQTEPYLIDSAKRFEAAPFRIDITQWETKNTPRLEISMFFFSRTDSDFINTLLEQGTSREQVKIVSYNKDRETGEWIQRDAERFTARALADLYVSLSPQNKEAAIAELTRLKQLS